MGKTYKVRCTYTPKVRLPLPKQTGGPQSTKHGARGYDRKREKQQSRDWA